MARAHGKNTYISVDGDDLSAYTNASDVEVNADSHDTTTYGASHHRYEAGLKDGAFKMSGFYETGVAGPRATLRPLVGGAAVPVIRRPEGTGAGKPAEEADCVVMKYTESNPVADYISWSAELQPVESWTDTTQS